IVRIETAQIAHKQLEQELEQKLVLKSQLAEIDHTLQNIVSCEREYIHQANVLKEEQKLIAEKMQAREIIIFKITELDRTFTEHITFCKQEYLQWRLNLRKKNKLKNVTNIKAQQTE